MYVEYIYIYIYGGYGIILCNTSRWGYIIGRLIIDWIIFASI